MKEYFDKTVRVKQPYRSSHIQVAIFSTFVCLGIAAISRFVDAIPTFGWVFLGLIAGILTYRVLIADTKNDSYASIKFLHDSFIVNFDFKPPLEIRYEDIVKVCPKFDSTPNTLMLTGNYPILELKVHDLEADIDSIFLKYIEREWLLKGLEQR